ncbi:MAG TPA: response regulator [Caulobacteraceae bacterium]
MESLKTAGEFGVPRCVPPLLQRVLIVDPDEGAVDSLVQLLRSISHCQVWTARDETGLAVASRIAPTILLVEQSAGLDGGDLVRRLRRSQTAVRYSVVMMLTATPTVLTIIAARECGAHEVIRKPFGRADLIRRLETVALEPRAWIETETYIGPDRRRFNSGDYGVVLNRDGDVTGSARAAA